MTPQERSTLINQLDKSFQAMPLWLKSATKHAMGIPEINREAVERLLCKLSDAVACSTITEIIGRPFASFREVIEAASDETLESLRDDFDGNGDLLPATATYEEKPKTCLTDGDAPCS